ncbi:MAG: AEC family transporter [Lachnospiraceae bacterium]|nr:AEC family transporter [Lachnospiraceae bacterium]
MNTILSTLYFAFNAVFPILALILLGYCARQKGMLTQEFIKPANRFNFRFGLSCLMFTNIYKLEGIGEIPLNIVFFVLFTVMVLTAAGFLIAHTCTGLRARRGVLIQAAFRSNFAIIGLPVATALAGSAGSALASALQAPTVIYYNFAAILCLTLYSDVKGAFSLKRVLRSIASNPLIFGLVTGLISLAVRAILPCNADGSPVFSLERDLSWLYTTISYLARMATPLALIVLGTQFNFTAVRGMKKELIAGVTARLIGAPVIGFALAFAAASMGIITLDATTIAVLIALFGSPMAVASVVMASEMNADDILAGQLVVWTTLLSMASVFVQIVIFRTAGLL